MVLASLGFSQDFLIIANTSVAKDKISTKEVVKIYKGKLTLWDDGTTVKASYPTEGKSSEWFFGTLIEAKPGKFKKYWLKKLFSGSGIPPTKFNTSEAIVDYVGKTKGAIGVVPASFKDKMEGCKVIELSK